MKRYLLFAGVFYYPSGGWNDFRGSFEDYNEARQHVTTRHFDWFQIVDAHTGDVLDRYPGGL